MSFSCDLCMFIMGGQSTAMLADFEFEINLQYPNVIVYFDLKGNKFLYLTCLVITAWPLETSDLSPFARLQYHLTFARQHSRERPSSPRDPGIPSTWLLFTSQPTHPVNKVQTLHYLRVPVIPFQRLTCDTNSFIFFMLKYQRTTALSVKHNTISG